MCFKVYLHYNSFRFKIMARQSNIQQALLKNFCVIAIRHKDFQLHEIYPVVPSKWINQEKELCPWLSSDKIEDDFINEIVKPLKDPPVDLKSYNMKILTTCGE